MVIDGVDYIGVDERLPTDIKYFKEELISTVFKKNSENTDIHSIVSVSVDCSIKSLKIINTPMRVSNDGQRLSGKKLLVEISLNYRIKYISNSKKQYIYILKPVINKVFYIVVPKEIENQKIEDLLRRRKIGVNSYVEDLYVHKIDKNNIYIRTLLLLNFNLKR